MGDWSLFEHACLTVSEVRRVEPLREGNRGGGCRQVHQ